MSDTFDAWHDEIENFATRGERLRELGWTEALRAAWLSSRRQALEEADETLQLLFRTVDALQSLLDDSQHKEHPDCEDGGYCPVRDAREAMRNFAAWQERRASAIRREAEGK